ncbi:TPA: glycine-rich domain-containing protein [Klebsiella variicola subsp. variicola]
MALKLIANNNAKSVLAAGISASATVITVGTGAGSLFPSPVSGQSYFKLTITDAATKTISEIMHVTSVSGDVMTVIRGQEGTTARVWSTNDIVANLMTAGSLLSFLQISNNLSEIKDAGEDAVNEARYNLGISDSSGFVGRSLGAPKAFYANGTYTRSPLARYAKVTLVGGGGGGGGCQASNNTETFSGAGGGAGATIIVWVDLSTASSYAITVGKGGVGGVGAVSGADGGATSFASLFSAPGGKGGVKSGVSNTAGGAGGTAAAGDIRINGGTGSDGQTGTSLLTGNGGASYFGGGGRAGAQAGIAGAAPGSGGGGAYDLGFTSTAYTGGAGADGILILEEFA